MIKINVIAMGKLKEKYLREASDEYSKRLSAYCSLNIKELEPERLPDKPSEKEISLALKKEADKIFAALDKNTAICTMCIEGKQLSSEGLSDKIRKLSGETSNITFIIGSSYGLDDSVKAKSSFKLSMSEMTFPHQLARIMLLEQIYRSFKITEGSAYHK